MKNTFDISTFVNVLTEEAVLEGVVKRIKLRRKELKLTQKKLAERSGVSYASLCRFEQTGEISLASLLKIANVMDCLNDFEGLFSTPKITNLKEYRV